MSVDRVTVATARKQRGEARITIQLVVGVALRGHPSFASRLPGFE